MPDPNPNPNPTPDPGTVPAPAPGPAPASGDPKTFTQEQVNSFVADHKRAAKTAEDQLAKLQKDLETLKTAQLSEAEKLQKQAVDDAVGKTKTEYEIRIRDMEIRALLREAGVHPDFIASAKEKLGEAPTDPKEIAAKAKELVEANPHFAAGQVLGEVQPGSPGSKGTPAKWNRARVREVQEKGEYDKHRKEINAAIAAGQFDYAS